MIPQAWRLSFILNASAFAALCDAVHFPGQFSVYFYLAHNPPADRPNQDGLPTEIMLKDALPHAKELVEYYHNHKPGGTIGPLHGFPVPLRDQCRIADTDAALGLVSSVDTIDTAETETFLVKGLHDLGAALCVKTPVLTSVAIFGSMSSPFVPGLMGARLSNVQLMTEAILSRRPWLYDPKVFGLTWGRLEYEEVLERGMHGGLVFGLITFDRVPQPPILRALDEVKGMIPTSASNLAALCRDKEVEEFYKVHNVPDYTAAVVTWSRVDQEKDSPDLEFKAATTIDELIQSHCYLFPDPPRVSAQRLIVEPKIFNPALIALQIMGRRFQEEKVLATAKILDNPAHLELHNRL
ncbi:hypothetical protein K488DRAFT_88194 [Vararia minispora EC-137]|uniref:Uncharacterized protein n=1 Tax=Vararia minispora EC-137 TaxID=1314806 RepID=A0ACB8QEB6_9AGAM|nr:hypothetical protein K488DRAFT_88194 [Vararia minispora EC-137]